MPNNCAASIPVVDAPGLAYFCSEPRGIIDFGDSTHDRVLQVLAVSRFRKLQTVD